MSEYAAMRVSDKLMWTPTTHGERRSFNYRRSGGYDHPLDQAHALALLVVGERVLAGAMAMVLSVEDRVAITVVEADDHQVLLRVDCMNRAMNRHEARQFNIDAVVIASGVCSCFCGLLDDAPPLGTSAFLRRRDVVMHQRSSPASVVSRSRTSSRDPLRRSSSRASRAVSRCVIAASICLSDTMIYSPGRYACVGSR